MKIVVAVCVSLDRLFPDEKHNLTSLFTDLCDEKKMLRWDRNMVQSYINQRLQDTPVRFTDQE